MAAKPSIFRPNPDPAGKPSLFRREPFEIDPNIPFDDAPGVFDDMPGSFDTPGTS